MKFEVIVGNPPYGVMQNGSSNLLHYMIMRISLDFYKNRNDIVKKQE